MASEKSGLNMFPYVCGYFCQKMDFSVQNPIGHKNVCMTMM